MPVLEGKRLVGVLSRADLMRVFLASMPQKSMEDISDSRIAERIEFEIKQQPWCSLENVRVAVKQGTAEISGVVADERVRDAIRILVENASGVTGMVDHLLTIEPVSGLIVKGPADT